MKAYLFICFATALSFISCNYHTVKRDDGTRLLDYNYFTIRVPQNWKRMDVKGMDSYIGEIQIDVNTKISFDLGWYSNSLDEGAQDFLIRHDSLFVKRTLPVCVSRVNYVFDYRGKLDSANIAPLRINKKQWLQIDGYRAKLITPRQPGKGTTGIYIDSLWKAGDANDKFQLSGHNLTLKQQQQLLAAVKTLKFYQHPEKRKKTDE